MLFSPIYKSTPNVMNSKVKAIQSLLDFVVYEISQGKSAHTLHIQFFLQVGTFEWFIP